MAITIFSRCELRKAVVSEDANGVSVMFYRLMQAGVNAKWVFDRETRPGAVWHVALDNTQAILNGPPRIHVGR